MKPRAKPDWFVLRDEDDYTTRRITVPLSCFMRASHSLSQIIEARWAEFEVLKDLLHQQAMGHQPVLKHRATVAALIKKLVGPGMPW